MSTQVFSALDRAIELALAEKRIVGTVVQVARHGDLLYRRSAGLADREANRPMQADLVFRIASFTKPIVTVAAMQLVEDGIIALDDPVTRYLPEFRPALPDGSRPVITLAHLLTHSAGLDYGFMQEPGSLYQRLGISDGLDHPDFDLAENLRRLAQAPLGSQPGTRFHYSLGLDVIGAVLEAASGETLPALVARRITGPLGMADTGFHARQPERLVRPYVNAEPEPIAMEDDTAFGALRFSPSRALDASAYPSGGAGMVGTAADMLAFFEAVRTDGAGIIRTETLADMKRDRFGAVAESDGPGWGFGLGWGVLADPVAYDSPQPVGTLQWGGAYGHHWFIDPLNGLTVIVLTNTALEGMWGQIKRDIRNAVYADLAL